MKKLSVLLLFITIVFLPTLQAQTSIEVMHEAGVSNLFLRYEYGVNTQNTNLAEVKDAQYFPGISYSPRFNFFEEDGEGSSSFSINLNNDFLFGNLLSSSFEKKSWAFMSTLSFNLNLGAGATKNSFEQFGGFVGIGYSYSNIHLVNNGMLNRITESVIADPTITPDYSKATVPLQGIYLHLGGRMKVGSGVVTLEGYSTLTPELNGVYTIGIRALYGFGIGL
ncbi:hypothetical protein [uncultured Microscilla sp.]|uniref:hypothetical protein n=1 Tax=uncultured Microscilla sp. TaxID=432653 RepID=UPI00263658F3|nr:hypothetical protein [uncultured Microscilla sp.]